MTQVYLLKIIVFPRFTGTLGAHAYCKSKIFHYFFIAVVVARKNRVEIETKHLPTPLSSTGKKMLFQFNFFIKIFNWWFSPYNTKVNIFQNHKLSSEHFMNYNYFNLTIKTIYLQFACYKSVNIISRLNGFTCVHFIVFK